MRRARLSGIANSPFRNAWPFSQVVAQAGALLGTLFLSLSLGGCADSCFIFVSNPGGGTIPNAPTCSLNQGNGNANLRIVSSPISPVGSGQADVAHIFVTIRGVEATANAIADEASPDWRELAPQLATKPMQLDLLTADGASCGANRLTSVAVRADAYRQIRLSLSSNQPDANEALPEENLCGSIGANCVVTSDGGMKPLVLDTKSSHVQISAKQIAGGFFQILPDTAVSLEIKFNASASQMIPTVDGVRLVPAFTVDPAPACESAGSVER
jgi:hypothetical protein